MACRTETKTIGDHDYSVTQWPATRSVVTKLSLIKVLGPALAKVAGLINTKSNKKSEEELDSEKASALSEGLQLLFANGSPEAITQLIKKSIVGISCDGSLITESSFETIFSGDDLLDVYKVFIFILQVNYASLMKGQLAESLLAKVSI